MTTVNVAEAKARLSALIEAALQGEEVVIARRNVPLVVLRPVERLEGGRRLGTLRGAIRMSDDFDATPADFDEYR